MNSKCDYAKMTQLRNIYKKLKAERQINTTETL